ncbi:hypothetical protein L208DRAFT_1406636 [Tricholoma matsutake]|nr:hypothetical protein L208DRAFT_1406636 [Tricholoma matsutake 945]
MLELVADIRYTEQKARRLLDMRRDVAHDIRRDCDLLKLPHPPRANIREPTLNGVTISWKTQKHSVLYDIVTSIIRSQDSKPHMKDAKLQCHIEKISLEERNGGDRHPLRRLRRGASRSRSPSPRLSSSLEQKRAVEKIDTVIENLRKLSGSLNPEVQVAVNSLPAPHRDLPRSNRVRKPRSETRREAESRLRNELARIQEEVKAAVFKAARIERELEAFNVALSPDTSHTTDTGTGVRAQLARAVTEMILEQRNRKEIEWMLADVERECRHPVIVPVMLEAMHEIRL